MAATLLLPLPVAASDDVDVGVAIQAGIGGTPQRVQIFVVKNCTFAALIYPNGTTAIIALSEGCEGQALYINAHALSLSEDRIHNSAQPLSNGSPAGVGSEGITTGLLANGQQFIASISGNTLSTAILNTAQSIQQPVGQYPVGPTPEHVVAADFNGDGNADLAVSNFGSLNNDTGGNIQIFLGHGDGTFTEGAAVNAGLTPVSISAADFNGDGKVDLAVTNVDQNNVTVVLGKGDGTFQPPSTIPVPPPAICPEGLQGCLASSLVTGDFNGDGRMDIAVGLHGGGTVSILLGNGDGTFKPAVSYPAGLGAGPISFLTTADLNGDGKLDVAVADPNSNGFSFLMGNGDGTLQAPVEYVTGAEPAYFALLAGNGHPVLITNDAISGESVVTPLTATGGTVAPQIHPLPVSPGLFPTGIAAADLNGDKFPDLIAADGFLSVLLRTAGADFSLPVQYSLQSGSAAVAVASADLNGDGHADIIAAGSVRSQGGTVDVVLGKGDGTLGQQYSYAIGGSPGGTFGNSPSGIVTGDFNGDGKPDVAAGFESASGSTGAGVSVLFGKGDGTLNSAINYSLNGAAVNSTIAGDFNGDGRLDIAAAVAQSSFSNAGSVALLLGKGDGTFQNPVYFQTGSPPATPVALAAGDLNGDRKLDLAVSVLDAQLNESLVILLGNGDGSFRQLPAISTGASGEAIAIADLNGDGNPDVVVADCCGLSESVYLLGNGDGTFSSPAHFSSGASVTAITVADWNGNGVAGLAMAQNAGIGLPGAVMAMQSGLNPKISGVNPLGTGSAAGGVTALAPGSLAASYGKDLATGPPISASTNPWPITLSGTTVTIADSSGASLAAPVYYASQSQVDYVIPAQAAVGPATISVRSGDGTVSSGPVTLQAVAPAVFTLNASSLAAAVMICATANGNVIEQVYQAASGTIFAAPINISGCSEAVLEVFATGIDSVKASEMQATIGGLPAAVQYAGPQGTFTGLDQVNLAIPLSLAGKGSVNVAITTAGQTANVVNVTIQ
jgi:uncharacterized protein (TIGR03437 family)